MFLNRRWQNFLKPALLLAILALIFWFFYRPETETKLSEVLKIRAGLPAHDNEISLAVEKNHTDQQFTVGDLAQNSPIYYSITNSGQRTIKPQVVINDFDWFTDKAILDFALKNLDLKKASDEEKALALLNFVVNNRYHWSPPLYDTSYYYLENPVRYLNA